MLKKLALILFGILAIVLIAVMGLPWWAYFVGIILMLVGLAWFGVYDANADASGGSGEMGQGS